MLVGKRQAGIHWMLDRPPNVYLEPVILVGEPVEWQDGLDGYIDYSRKKGWTVNGR